MWWILPRFILRRRFSNRMSVGLGVGLQNSMQGLILAESGFV
jgi:hypothetical protein